MSMIFGMVEIPDVPVDPVMPPTATIDDVQAKEVADPEFEAETDEEILEAVEEASYEGLTETDEAMVDAIMHISLTDAPLATPSGSTTVDVTPGTDDQSDATDIDASTNGGTA